KGNEWDSRQHGQRMMAPRASRGSGRSHFKPNVIRDRRLSRSELRNPGDLVPSLLILVKHTRHGTTIEKTSKRASRVGLMMIFKPARSGPALLESKNAGPVRECNTRCPGRDPGCHLERPLDSSNPE